MNDDERREAGFRVAAEMVGEEVATALRAATGSKAFGASRGDMALRNVFAELWTRPGLDRKSRSLFTLGILVARGQATELRIHLMAAIRNGWTVSEIEEALYHACAYAGYVAREYMLPPG